MSVTAGEVLRYCAGKYTMALGSGSPRELIEAALTANDWKGLFAQTVSSDEAQEASRPRTSILKRCGGWTGKGSSVVVEDSGSGILAGKAAGAGVIDVSNHDLMPDPEVLEQADKRVASLHEMPAALEEFETRTTVKKEEHR